MFVQSMCYENYCILIFFPFQIMQICFFSIKDNNMLTC